MVNEAAEPCSIGIYDTDSEIATDVANLIFEKLKEFSDGADHWKTICKKVRGFMGDQGI